ncbi:MAG: tetratricopeptide repeat protein [Vicinamibacterales bacterium]
MNRRRPICTAILAFLLAGTSDAPIAGQSEDTTAVRRQAFALSYNLDREEALGLLRQAVARHPTDPAAHRALASVLWLTMLFKRGAVTVDHYLGSFSRTQVELSKPPADLDAEFRTHVARAIALAEARVAKAPGDVQARYDLGAAVGLQASHIATVQGKMFAGFKAARRAFDEHEKVLALDNTRTDAGLVVGTYRYVVSTLSLPLRMMAYVVGFGGGRERGIQMVEAAAAQDGESKTDAMFALVLLYNRERRYDDALRVLGELRKMHPRNRLVVLEAGATALRGKRAAEAERLLSEGLEMVAKETRPLMPGEEALWRYKRGAARLALNNTDGAKADLHAALGPSAQDWVRGRAHAELARLAMRGGDHASARTQALRAESLCRQGSDAPCVDAARELARSARGR